MLSVLLKGLKHEGKILVGDKGTGSCHHLAQKMKMAMLTGGSDVLF